MNDEEERLDEALERVFRAMDEANAPEVLGDFVIDEPDTFWRDICPFCTEQFDHYELCKYKGCLVLMRVCDCGCIWR